MIKLLVLFSVVPCGLLWAMGGSAKYPKFLRRILCTLPIIGCVAMVEFNWWILLIMPLMWAASSRGYGIPDSTDEGSGLGKFWFSVVKEGAEDRFAHSEKTAFMANCMTRLTVSVLYGLALFPLITIGNWALGFLFCVANTMLWTVFIKGEGEVKNLGVEEFFVGCGIAISAFLAIL